jgi:hypothetical protein
MSGSPAGRSRPRSAGRGLPTDFDVYMQGSDFPHLSWDRMIEHRNRTHPRAVSTGLDGKARFAKLSGLTLNVGCHKACPSACKAKTDTGDVIKFGVGLSLFFKFVKFVIVLMAVLSLLMLPPIVLYTIGDTNWRTSTTSEAAEATQLWRFTPANIGTTSTLCGSIFDGEDGELEFKCPEGTVITGIEAHYGQNGGECGCPAAQMPKTSDQCPGKRSADNRCVGGVPCHYSSARAMTMPSGNILEMSPCCSGSLNEVGMPAFPELDLAIDSTHCWTTQAQRIADALCLRQPSCRVSPNPTMLHVWKEAQIGGLSSRVCNRSEVDLGMEVRRQLRNDPNTPLVFASDMSLPLSDTDVVCAASLSSYGDLNMQQCRETVTNPKLLNSWTYKTAWPRVYNTTGGMSNWGPVSSMRPRLFVTATCSAMYVELSGYLKVSKDSIASIVMVCDLLMVAGFLLAIRVLAKRESEENDTIVTASPADYTVLIQSLPPHRDTRELERTLREHLGSYLRECVPVVKDNSQLGPHLCSVADVNFGYDSEMLTELKVKHGDLANELQLMVANLKARGWSWEDMKRTPDYRLLVEQGGGCAVRCCNGLCIPCCASDVLKLSLEIETIKAHLASVNKQIQDVLKKGTVFKAVYAYVTFVEEEAVFRAKAEFPNSSCYAKCCLPTRARLPYRDPSSGKEKRWPIKVSRAEEPDDINWENMRYARSSGGTIRRAFGAALTLVFLVGAFFAIYFLERQKIIASRQYPPVDCAAFDTPYDKVLATMDERFGDFGLLEGRTGRINCFCLSLWANASGNPFVLFDEQFFVPNSVQVAERDSGLLYVGSNGMTQGGKTGTGVRFSGPPDGWRLEPLCGQWLEAFAQVQVFTYGSAVAILLLKLLLVAVIRFAVRNEKRTSKTEASLSRASKMFISQFVVTALLVLVINARINEPALSDIVIGDYPDFDARWYKGPGTAIMLTMLLNIFFDNFTPFRRVVMRRFTRCRDRGCRCPGPDHPPAGASIKRFTKKPTQAELNELYSGILMPMDELYASLVNQVFVCIVFSTGMPLLLPIAGVFSLLFFFTHKCLFVNSYRMPTSTSAILSKKMTAFLPVAALIHLFIGAWMLSNPVVFPSTSKLQAAMTATTLDFAAIRGQNELDTAIKGFEGLQSSLMGQLQLLQFSGYNIGDRLSKPHVFPMFFIGLLMLAWGVLRLTLGRALTRFLRGLFTTCRCCCSCFLRAEDAGFENLRPYWDALPDSVLADFPRKYQPKPELIPFYKRAKQRRQEARFADQKAQRVAMDRVQELRDERDKLEALSAVVEDLAAKVAASDGVGEEAARDREELSRATDEINKQAAKVKTLQTKASEAHSAAARARHAKRLTMLQAAGEASEETEQADSEARIMSSSTTHSYAIDDNASYMTRFGFHVLASLADPVLASEVALIMPSAHGSHSVIGEESEAQLQSVAASVASAAAAAEFADAELGHLDESDDLAEMTQQDMSDDDGEAVDPSTVRVMPGGGGIMASPHPAVSSPVMVVSAPTGGLSPVWVSPGGGIPQGAVMWVPVSQPMGVPSPAVLPSPGGSPTRRG